MAITKRLTGLTALVLSACSLPATSDDAASPAESEAPLYYDAPRLWSDPTISVCWATANFATEKTWVRNAVEAAFEQVTAINFTGWNDCTNGGAAEVVISWSVTDWPRAARGARVASATPNVKLNPFTGAQRDVSGDGIVDDVDLPRCWETSPAGSNPFTGETGRIWPTGRQRCIEVIAVHEFAHVLSIAHEWQRPDTPSSCVKPAEEPDEPDLTSFGYWDITSISNGCNPAYDNDGYLSQLDIAGLETVYGPRTNDQLWFGIGNVRDYGGAAEDRLLFAVRRETVPNGYKPIAGDFDGDGVSDLFLYAPGTAADVVYYGNPNGSWTTRAATVNGSAYNPVAADFNGDGEDDVLWYSPGSTTAYIWFGSASRVFTDEAFTVRLSRNPVAGDFDGDGKGDIFWYATGNATDYVWFGRGDRTFDERTYGVSGTYYPFTGDFDSDGRSDVFWYGPGNLPDHIWWGRTNRAFDSTATNVGGVYNPVTGDFDSDGVTDILWSHESENDPVWLFTATRGTYVDTATSSVLGTSSSGDPSKPYTGDFDGDGVKDDVFWYKPN